MSWSKPEDVCVVLCTAPDGEVAARIGRELVEAGLVACANIVPAVRSIYRWEGAVCDEREALMVLKTRSELLPQVGEAIKGLHPYENPEVISLPVDGGLEAYLGWVRESTARG
jgi:periplasmic divalent cation tolerance protein